MMATKKKTSRKRTAAAKAPTGETTQPARKHVVPPGGFKRIKAMAQAGCRERDIASSLNLTPAQWAALKRRDPRALKAYEDGRIKEHEDLRNAAHRLAMSDSPQAGPMLRFLLESRFGYRTAEPASAGTESARVEITLKIPAAMSEAEWREYLKRTSVPPAPEGEGEKSGHSPVVRYSRA